MIDALLEKNLLPDWLLRIGIRRLLAQRIRDESAVYDRAAYVADLKTRPLAEQTAAVILNTRSIGTIPLLVPFVPLIWVPVARTLWTWRPIPPAHLDILAQSFKVL